jgi:alpha-amylase
MKTTRIFAFALAVVPFLVQPACVAVPESDRPALTTEVEDWRDEVVYQVLIDRFADGDINNNVGVRAGALARYQGGDWKGLTDKLGYIEALGVTTLWISPIVRNVETDADVDGYHGYWAQNLAQLNYHFGDMSQLRTLVKEAHARKLKVVLDIVTNHMGQAFFYDMNLNGKADIYIGGTGSTSKVERVSEFDPDWDPRGVQASTSLGLAGPAPIVFINDAKINRVAPGPGILGTARAYHGLGRILNYDVPAQTELGDFPGGLKDVATELPEVRATMVDAYTKWVEETNLDGFRIDTVKHVEHGFWQTFAPAVRARLARQGKKQFLMFGEAFDGNDQLLGSYTKNNEMDSVFNFSQHYQVFRDVFVNANKDGAQKGTKQIEESWKARAVNWGSAPAEGGVGVAPSKMPVNFIDNHDVARFLYEAKGNVAALRNALTLLLLEEGIPCLYYGTEQEFKGGNDPANREVMWTTGYATNGETFQLVSKLNKLRKKSLALRRGDTAVLWASERIQDEQDAGVFAFERFAGAESSAVVVLNTNGRKASSTANGSAVMKVKRPNTTYVDALDPARSTYVSGADGALNLTVKAQSAMVLIPQGDAALR